jgi:hypothetical protein
MVKNKFDKSSWLCVEPVRLQPYYARNSCGLMLVLAEIHVMLLDITVKCTQHALTRIDHIGRLTSCVAR